MKQEHQHNLLIHDTDSDSLHILRAILEIELERQYGVQCARLAWGAIGGGGSSDRVHTSA